MPKEAKQTNKEIYNDLTEFVRQDETKESGIVGLPADLEDSVKQMRIAMKISDDPTGEYHSQFGDALEIKSTAPMRRLLDIKEKSEEHLKTDPYNKNVRALKELADKHINDPENVELVKEARKANEQSMEFAQKIISQGEEISGWTRENYDRLAKAYKTKYKDDPSVNQDPFSNQTRSIQALSGMQYFTKKSDDEICEQIALMYSKPNEKLTTKEKIKKARLLEDTFKPIMECEDSKIEYDSTSEFLTNAGKYKDVNIIANNAFLMDGLLDEYKKLMDLPEACCVLDDNMYGEVKSKTKFLQTVGAYTYSSETMQNLMKNSDLSDYDLDKMMSKSGAELAAVGSTMNCKVISSVGLAKFNMESGVLAGEKVIDKMQPDRKKYGQLEPFKNAEERNATYKTITDRLGADPAEKDKIAQQVHEDRHKSVMEQNAKAVNELKDFEKTQGKDLRDTENDKKLTNKVDGLIALQNLQNDDEKNPFRMKDTAVMRQLLDIRTEAKKLPDSEYAKAVLKIADKHLKDPENRYTVQRAEEVNKEYAYNQKSIKSNSLPGNFGEVEKEYGDKKLKSSVDYSALKLHEGAGKGEGDLRKASASFGGMQYFTKDSNETVLENMDITMKTLDDCTTLEKQKMALEIEKLFKQYMMFDDNDIQFKSLDEAFYDPKKKDLNIILRSAMDSSFIVSQYDKLMKDDSVKCNLDESMFRDVQDKIDVMTGLAPCSTNPENTHLVYGSPYSYDLDMKNIAVNGDPVITSSLVTKTGDNAFAEAVADYYHINREKDGKKYSILGMTYDELLADYVDDRKVIEPNEKHTKFATAEERKARYDEIISKLDPPEARKEMENEWFKKTEKNYNEYVSTVNALNEQAAEKLRKLDASVKGSRNSDEYTNMRNAVAELERVTKEEPFETEKISKALDNVYTTSGIYEDTHSGIKGLFKGNTKFGKDRLNQSRDINEFARNSMSSFEEKYQVFRNSTNKNKSIDTIMAEASAKIEKINNELGGKAVQEQQKAIPENKVPEVREQEPEELQIENENTVIANVNKKVKEAQKQLNDERNKQGAIPENNQVASQYAAIATATMIRFQVQDYPEVNISLDSFDQQYVQMMEDQTFKYMIDKTPPEEMFRSAIKGNGEEIFDRLTDASRDMENERQNQINAPEVQKQKEKNGFEIN